MKEQKPDVGILADIAIHLDKQYKKGKALPLGKVHLDNLWKAIDHLK